MSRKIPCDIIKDLMPLYVEGLTSEETGREIEAHLEGCGECRDLYKRMKQEVEGGKDAGGSAKAGEIGRVRRVPCNGAGLIHKAVHDWISLGLLYDNLYGH